MALDRTEQELMNKIQSAPTSDSAQFYTLWMARYRKFTKPVNNTHSARHELS